MLGEKDAATQQYEREIRLGMILLGVLCVAFVGVLARRIWVENRQEVAANKKPVYLTKAQRDDLRVRNKPRSLATLNASTPMRRLRSTKDVEAKSANSTAEQALENVPDLSIGDDAPEESKSQPANYLQQSEPETVPEQEQKLAKETANKSEKQPDQKPATPPESEPEAAPRKPAPLKQAPSANHESAKSEIDFAPAPAQNNNSSADQESRAGEPSSTRGSRFSDPQPEESKPEETMLEEPEAEEPVSEPALRLLPKINPPALSESRQPISDKPTEASGENASEKGDASPSAAPEVVRKKVAKNPWKRPAATAPKQHHPHYTVQSGDTLKSIAQEILSDETRWQEIYDLNRSEIGDDYSYLRKGLRLKLPKANEAPPELADPKAASAKIEP